jgi:hypothetical protein
MYVATCSPQLATETTNETIKRGPVDMPARVQRNLRP